jgi:hypothetical protein
MAVLNRLIEMLRARVLECMDDHAHAGAGVVTFVRAVPMARCNRSGLTGCWALDPNRNALVFVWSREDEAQTLDLAKAA